MLRACGRSSAWTTPLLAEKRYQPARPAATAPAARRGVDESAESNETKARVSEDAPIGWKGRRATGRSGAAGVGLRRPGRGGARTLLDAGHGGEAALERAGRGLVDRLEHGEGGKRERDGRVMDRREQRAEAAAHLQAGADGFASERQPASLAACSALQLPTLDPILALSPPPCSPSSRTPRPTSRPTCRPFLRRRPSTSTLATRSATRSRPAGASPLLLTRPLAPSRLPVATWPLTSRATRRPSDSQRALRPGCPRRADRAPQGVQGPRGPRRRPQGRPPEDGGGDGSLCD